jgi:hypothetical protein
MTDKTCSRCGSTKPFCDFPKRKISKDGYEGVCRACRTQGKKDWYGQNREKYRASNKKWADQNKDQIRSKNQKWLEQNKDRVAQYREKNKAHIRKMARQWQKDNPERCVFNVSMRRSAKIKATPKWLTSDQKDMIFKIYEEARAITQETKIPHDVDHIVPLRGKNVCGLHVPWNLQIIPSEQNRRKSNNLALPIETC